jgi:hypothetical protein
LAAFLVFCLLFKGKYKRWFGFNQPPCRECMVHVVHVVATDSVSCMNCRLTKST